jgi:hypothetical protein
MVTRPLLHLLKMRAKESKMNMEKFFIAAEIYKKLHAI